MPTKPTEPCSAQAQRLIAEARQHRVPGQRPPVSLEDVQSTLGMLLDTILESFNYQIDPASTPGFVCRVLAALLADIEDSPRRLS